MLYSFKRKKFEVILIRSAKNLSNKELLTLIKTWKEWSDNTSYTRKPNYHEIYEKRKANCNLFKDILILNYKIFDRLNKRNKIAHNNRLTFHGGCLKCNSQFKFGIKNCGNCQYFKAEWNKPNLSNVTPQKSATIDTVFIEDNKEKKNAPQVSDSFAQASKEIIDEEKGIIVHKKRSTIIVLRTCFLLKL